MATPPLNGPALFLGDSNTVGIAPFIQTTGARSELAEVGWTAVALLPKLRAVEAAGGLDDGTRIATVLLGTNDMGGGLSAETIFTTIQSIWAILTHHGIQVFAMTVPPFKGWPNYASGYVAIEARRKRLNELLRAAVIPDQPGRPEISRSRLIDLDRLVADLADPERLSATYDAGDRLHLKKPLLGALIQAQVAGLPAPLTPSGPSTPATVGVSNRGLYLVTGAIVIGAVLMLARKRGYGLRSSSRLFFAKT